MSITANKQSLLLLLFLMVFIGMVGLYSFHQLHNEHLQSTEQVKIQQLKVHHLRKMYDAARERSFIIFKMTLTDDTFKLDGLHQEFRAKAAIFIQNRLEINRLILSNEEQALLDKQEFNSKQHANAYRIITELLVNGKKEDALKWLNVDKLEGQKLMLRSIHNISQYYENESNKHLENYSHFIEKSGQIVKTISIGLYLFVILSIVFLFKRIYLQKDKAYKQLYEKQTQVVNKLTLSDKKLTSFISSLSTYTGILTLDGRIELLNNSPSNKSDEVMDVVGMHFSESSWWSYDEDIKKQVNIDIENAVKGEFIKREVDIQVGEKAFIKVLFFIHPIFDSNQKVEYLVIEGQDITERSINEEKLTYQASHDVLTGLTNRREFEIQLTHILTKKSSAVGHAILYLDLDNFKIINDTCGHVAGDELLRQIPKLIEDNIRVSDVLSRLGGDEFGVILKACSQDRAEHVSKSIIHAFNDFIFSWGEYTFRVGVSIGILMVKDPMPYLDEVFKNIDTACYAAKDAGRNGYYVYAEEDESMQNQMVEMSWLSKIENAILDDDFVLYAQAIMPLQGDKKSKMNYEFLVRMKDSDGNIIPPGAFLPAAERYNKIIGIDRWVIKEAFSILTFNPQFVQNIGYCSINLSSQAFANEELIDFIYLKLLENEGLEKKICFEITETDAITNLTQAKKVIAKFQKMGVRFALDDFGSGISSFGYLKSLPIDLLKIDGMFVKGIMDDPVDFAMVQSIHQLATVMNIETVAEFVENTDIADKLRKLGVTYGQGYGLGKPRNIADIVKEYTTNF